MRSPMYMYMCVCIICVDAAIILIPWDNYKKKGVPFIVGVLIPG